MVAEGLLDRTGQGRGTRYVLPAKPEPERAPFVIETRQRNRVLHAARGGQLTGEAVRSLLDVGADHAEAILDALVGTGDLERHSWGRMPTSPSPRTRRTLYPHGPRRQHRPRGQRTVPPGRRRRCNRCPPPSRAPSPSSSAG